MTTRFANPVDLTEAFASEINHAIRLLCNGCSGTVEIVFPASEHDPVVVRFRGQEHRCLPNSAEHLQTNFFRERTIAVLARMCGSVQCSRIPYREVFSGGRYELSL